MGRWLPNDSISLGIKGTQYMYFTIACDDITNGWPPYLYL